MCLSSTRRARSISPPPAEAEISVSSVERKPYRRSPYPPFRTSTLQQEAGRKLGFSASRTMSAAQRLYERGYITYMRTDSTALSESAVAAARSEIERRFGPRVRSLEAALVPGQGAQRPGGA